MKYRRLSPSGDYLFGFGNTSFATDLEAVRQAIQTKLKLFQGEYWEDLNDGLPFFQQIAGISDKSTIDMVIRTRILETPHVTGILSFVSTLDSARKYKATVSVETDYGTTAVGVNA